MKQKTLTLLLLIIIYLSSCRKDSVKPQVIQGPGNPKTNASNTVLQQDTAIKGYLRVQLADFSANTDNVLIEFNPAAKTNFVKNEDAPTLLGFGMVSLSSLSSDNVALAINVLPLTETGATVNLKINGKADGIYKLNLTAVDSIPGKFQIWLMDKYKKDSLDFRHNPTYAFDLINADTSSYGSHRFTMVIRK